MATTQLPPELIFEILQRLPVKSLLRFKCLSKSSCTLINSPDFIKSHSSQKFNLRKLIFEDLFTSEFLVYDVNVDLEQEILCLKNPVSSLWRDICGYCNGLLLLSVTECRFAVWNPSTRQYRCFAVPPNCQYDDIVGWGFGYDDSIDDYKAFCIVNVKQEDQPSSPKLEVQVWIYELKSNIWREAAQCFPFLDYRFDEGSSAPRIGHFSDSSMHWLIEADAWEPEIVEFDVRKETFSLVPQPVCPIKSMEGVLSELHVLDGCLCISYWKRDPPRHAYLYMRKNDGVDGFRWTELYSVIEPRSVDIPPFYFVNVLGHSKRGDKILLDFYRGSSMFWYDLKKKHFETVEVDINSNWAYPILCLESLVSVGGGGGTEHSSLVN